MAEPSDISDYQIEPERALHRRLMEQDPTAPDDVAVAFLEPLIGWLAARNPRLHNDLISEAAEEAILTLIRNPGVYDPHRGGLESYLRMSAQGDLRNLLSRESRHHIGRVPLEVVEHSDKAGNYLGRDDDPSLRMRMQEQLEGLGSTVPPCVWEGLTAPETLVLKLMLRGERSTDVFAEAYGVADRPLRERRRIVKQVKDRLKKRIERAGRDDEHAS
jgi:RNA polymerase sigma-70 factor (ECF subfamily)